MIIYIYIFNTYYICIYVICFLVSSSRLGDILCILFRKWEWEPSQRDNSVYFILGMQNDM